MKTKKIQLDEIRLDDQNARTHDERNIKTIANSLQRFGQQKPIVIDGDGVVVAGNGTVEAARALGWESIQVVQTKLTGSDARAFAIADNRTSDLSDWHYNTLINELGNLEADMQEAIGFSEEDIAELIKSPLFKENEVEEDETPEPPVDPTTKPGDLILLGGHRLLCGDTTNADDVSRLMNGEIASMVHADPPYGMGKEKDGIANDNLYREKLDAFQMAWWSAWRSSVADNGSAYVWGNAADLWRLWYLGGLADSERMTMRNEIAWWKGDCGFGVGSESQRCYFPTERCLFFMLGEQGFNNNADNYWEGWEPRTLTASEKSQV